MRAPIRLQAAKAAASAQIAIVFVTQWMTEGQDSATLSLPDKQDDLVAAVAAANPNTIVVLENGGPVNMPWAPRVKGIVESWYPGIGGGEAIANILFGRVNPSGKLPVTFAASDDQLPHPKVTGLTERTGNNADAVTRTQPRQRPTEFDVDYNVEGMAVGYRWFQEKNLKPQFAFGFGLSYTRFAYSNLKVDADGKSVSFDLRNTGARAGDEIAEVYVTLPSAAGEPFRKLAGWKRVSLAAGASQTVTVALDPLYLSIYSRRHRQMVAAGGRVPDRGWRIVGGASAAQHGEAGGAVGLSHPSRLRQRWMGRPATSFVDILRDGYPLLAISMEISGLFRSLTHGSFSTFNTVALIRTETWNFQGFAQKKRCPRMHSTSDAGIDLGYAVFSPGLCSGELYVAYASFWPSYLTLPFSTSPAATIPTPR